MASIPHTAHTGIASRLVIPAALVLAVAGGFAGGLVIISLIGPKTAARPSVTVISHFFQEGHVRDGVLRSGWSRPKPPGTVSLGPRADLALTLDDGRGTDLALKFEFEPLAVTSAPDLAIDVSVNGMRLATWADHEAGVSQWRRVTVPRAVWDLARPATVSLAFSDSRRHASVAPGMATGTSRPGITLKTVSILRYAY